MEETSKNQRQSKPARTSITGNITKGQVLSYHFFLRHWIGVCVVMGMILMSMANKYDCQRRITQIKSLQEDLVNAQNDRVSASAAYNSIIRESNMAQLIKQKNIDLQTPEQPPIELP